MLFLPTPIGLLGNDPGRPPRPWFANACGPPPTCHTAPSLCVGAYLCPQFQNKYNPNKTPMKGILTLGLALQVAASAQVQTPTGSGSWIQLRDVELLEDLVKARVQNGKTNEPAGVIRQYLSTTVDSTFLAGRSSTNLLPMTITNTIGIRKIESVLDLTKKHSVLDPRAGAGHSVLRAPVFSIGELRLEWQRARAIPPAGSPTPPVRALAPVTIQGPMNSLEINRVVTTPSLETR